MIKAFAWILGAVLFSLLWICSVSEAQKLPVQHSGASIQSAQSQTGQTQNTSQKRPNQPSEQRKRQSIPKPDRNKLEEAGRKRAACSCKRKARGKNASKKNRKTVVLSNEDVQPPSTKKKKEVEVKETERVDDIPLLIAAMEKMGIQKIIDQHIPVQKHQRDLSWGWTAVIWLAYILSEGNHRKVSVREYIRGMQHTLSEITGQKIEELDFTDDRLTILLSYLSKEEIWERIEEGLSQNTIEAHELPTDTSRVDATTVSGSHETVEEGLFQFGNSKDDPSRPQIKIMTGSLDPLGMPLATDVVSGEQADDGLYAPIISRISSILKKKGVLYVGDSKLSSFDNRLHIKSKEVNGHYLCPLPNTGKTPEQMKEWVDAGNEKDGKDELIKYIEKNRKGEEEVKAKGYEIEREQRGEVEGKELIWQERVLIVKSPAHEKQKRKGLERRLKNAEKKLLKLTPARGRGKRQIKEEATLLEKGSAILKQRRVEGLLSYEYDKEVERKEKYKGKGRGSDKREKIVEEKIRYQITKVVRQEEKIKEETKSYGWKAYVTDVTKKRLDFIGVVKCYRKQYSVEQIFKRLKSRLHISPLYVKRDDQAKGMTHLLTLGVRVYTLIEFVVRRSLQKSGEKLVGLVSGNPKKATDTPTCERLLKAFSGINLTFTEVGGIVTGHLSPLSQLQINILRHLGVDAAVYNNLSKMQI